MSGGSLTFSNWRRGLRQFKMSCRIQARVLSALMVRDGLVRFGRENLGIFWLFGEPMVLTAGVMVLWTITSHIEGHHIGVIPFVLSAYSMLTLWRHVVSKSVHALRNNIGLLFHRDIKHLDILIAQTILECLAGLSAFFVAYFPLLLFGAVEPIYDPLLLIGGWVLMTWLSFSFGLILAGLSEIYEAVERFVPPVLYVSLPFTGSFFMVSWLPEKAQKAVLWSPLVHAFEMFRAGMFGPDFPTYWSFWFPVGCCLVMTSIGLPLVRAAQKHVQME